MLGKIKKARGRRKNRGWGCRGRIKEGEQRVRRKVTGREERGFIPHIDTHSLSLQEGL